MGRSKIVLNCVTSYTMDNPFSENKVCFYFRTLETDNATLQQVSSINNNGSGHIITNNSGDDEEMDPDEV